MTGRPHDAAPGAPVLAADGVTVRPSPSAPESADEPRLVRVRLDLAYDGTDFRGWATQPGLTTVQGTLEDGLETILRRPVRTVVAGRTDAGVHAAHQVVHLDLSEGEWEGLVRGRAGLAPGESLVRRLHGVLRRSSDALVVRSAVRAPDGFDARFSALWRSYRYRISDRPETRDPLRRRDTYWHREPLDEARMQAEAASVVGLHDFLSYCKPRPEGTTIRELQSFTVERGADGVLECRLRADAFCHHMVRALVAAAVAVGEGRHAPGWTAERLDARVRDSLSRLAPPHALVLDHVEYPDDGSLAARAEGTRARRVAAETERGAAGGPPDGP